MEKGLLPRANVIRKKQIAIPAPVLWCAVPRFTEGVVT